MDFARIPVTTGFLSTDDNWILKMNANDKLDFEMISVTNGFKDGISSNWTLDTNKKMDFEKGRQ